MADRNLSLGVEADNNSINQAKRRLQELEQAQNDLRQAFVRGDTDASAFTSELSKLEKEARSLSRALDAVAEPRSIDVQTDRFDQVSRDVGLAGDVESNVRTIGGAAGALGLTGVEQGIGIAAEIPAVLEALPRFGESLRGIGDVARTAATSLGTTVPTLGALGAATIALAAAFSLAQRAAEESRRAIQGVYQLEQDRNNILQESRTLTDEELQSRLEEAQARQAVAQQNAEFAQAVEDQLNQQRTGLKIAGELSAALGVGNQAFAETDKQVQETAQALSLANQEVELYQQAIDANTNATVDARLAEEELAAARTQAAFAAAAAAEQAARDRQRAADFTSREDAQRQIDALQGDREAAQARLAALKASGDQSEQTVAEIERLETQLDSLTQRIQFFNSRAGGLQTEAEIEAAKAAEKERELAQSRENTATATGGANSAEQQRQRKLEEQQRQAEQAAEQAARAQQQYNSAIREAKNTFRDAIVDIGNRLGDALVDVRTQISDRLQDLRTNFQQDELRNERKFLFDREKLQRDAERSELEAERGRRFDEIRRIRENTADQISEQNLQAEFEKQERLIAVREEQQALALERQRGIRDAQRDAQRAERDAALARHRQLRDAREVYNDQIMQQNDYQRRSLDGWRRFYVTLLDLQNQALGTTGSAHTTPSARSGFGSSGGVSVDDMSFIVSGL